MSRTKVQPGRAVITMKLRSESISIDLTGANLPDWVALHVYKCCVSGKLDDTPEAELKKLMGAERMTDDEIKKECERLFQNGGPRTYAQRNKEWGAPLMGYPSAPHALKFADEGDRIWNRRKVNGSYQWKMVGVVK